MRFYNICILFFLSLLCINTNAQTILWQETFDPSPLGGWNFNVSTGNNDPDANYWDVSDFEGGVASGGCGVASNGNQTMHITNNLFPGSGASYNAGGFCGFGFLCVETNTRAETPTISTAGTSTPLTLSFDYIESGDVTIDDFSVLYSINNGATWLPLSNPVKTLNASCAGQGLWTAYSIALPSTCNNNPNVKIGFNWTNNDDGVGTDPSVAINDIKITTPSSSNLPPIAVLDTVVVPCNASLFNFNPTFNDSDPNVGQMISLTGFANSVSSGSVNIASGNLITFTPNANFTGYASVDYIICDNALPSLCDTATIVFSVSCNQAPIALNDIDTVYCNSGLATILVLQNDSDPNAGQLLSVTGILTQGSTNGTITSSANNVQYLPTTGFFGITTFKYIVCDNGSPSFCDTASVTVYVLPCIDSVIAVDDTVNVLCNNGFITVFPLGNDITTNANNTITLLSTYVGGYASITNNYTSTSFDYSPLSNYSGLSYVNYLVCDNATPQNCDTGTVYFNIAPCNQYPVAVADAYSTICNSSIAFINVLSNDTDPDTGQNIAVSFILTQPSFGSIIGTLNNLTFSPPANWSGTTSFTYVICDNGSPSLCDTGIVTITVGPCPNTKPIANNDNISVQCSTTFTISTLLNNDLDVDAGQVINLTSLITTGSTGTFTQLGNNVVFTPNAGQTGTTTFSYVICDNGTPSLCDTATCTIVLVNCNTKPSAINDNVSVPCATTFTITNLLSNDTDVDAGQTINVSSIIIVGGTGTFTQLGNNVEFTPNAGQTGTTTFSYVICDNGSPSLCDTATCTITILPCNIAPNAQADNVTVPCAGSYTIATLLNNDADPNTGQTISISNLFSNGTIGSVIQIGNAVVFTPIAGQTGTTSFQYVICDNGTPSLCDTALCTITIGGCNLPPNAVTDSIIVFCNVGVVIAAMLNDSDPDSNQTFTITQLITTNLQGTAAIVNGNINYNPPLTFAGITSFQYIITDNGNPALSDTGLIYVVVSGFGCNGKPDALNDSIATPCGVSASLNLIANDYNFEPNQILTITLINVSGIQGTLTQTGSTVTFTPPIGYNGVQTFQYIVCDNGNPVKCDTANVVLLSNGCNSYPIASNDLIFTACNSLVNILPLQNDTDPDINQTLNFSILFGPNHGTATVANNTISYTPDFCYSGNDTILYKLCDNGIPSLCDTGVIIITAGICNCNFPPIAIADVVTIGCNSTFTINPLTNDLDPNAGQIISLTTIIKSPSHGTYVTNGNSIIYTPANCFSGLDTMAYSVCDNANPSLCDTAFIYITIGACACIPPVANFSASKIEICAGDCINFTDLSTNNPTAWQWGFAGASTTLSTVKNPTNICYPNAGVYTVSLIATNAYGSSVPEIKSNYILVNPNPVSTTINLLDTIGKTIFLNGQFGSGNNTYNWLPSTGLSSTTIAQPQLTIKGNATYICDIENVNGCKGTVTYNISIVPGVSYENYLSVPNAFSPNNDGINDSWQVKSRNIKTFEVIIVNRWGQKVFTANSVNTPWFGSFNGYTSSPNVFFYYIKAEFNNGEKVEKKGDITVVH